MNSKEVEKMKNEEVLEILLGNVDYKDYSSETMRLVNSCVSRLWEILERLEVLENNSNKVIKDSVKLINKNLELQQRLKTLKKSNKEIEELYLNENKHWCETTDSLRKENEKLKKAIALLKLMFNFEVDVETETIYCCLGDVSVNGANLIEDFELLKEVLSNE